MASDTADIPQEIDEIIAKAVGDDYDGYADKIDTPNNWASAVRAAATIRAALRKAGYEIVRVRQEPPTDPIGIISAERLKYVKLKPSTMRIIKGNDDEPWPPQNVDQNKS